MPCGEREGESLVGGASVSLANTCQYIPNLGQPFIHKSDECGAPRAVREKPRRREVVCAI